MSNAFFKNLRIIRLIPTPYDMGIISPKNSTPVIVCIVIPLLNTTSYRPTSISDEKKSDTIPDRIAPIRMMSIKVIYVPFSSEIGAHYCAPINDECRCIKQHRTGC